jgi:hypothetical protein
MEESTLPIPQEPAAGTPDLDPARWEDFEGFRETFLLNFTDPEQNQALRTMACLLYNLILEAAHATPGPEEGWVRAHVRAALADLRFLQGFLAFLGEERRAEGLAEDERELCRAMGRKARTLGKIAEELAAGLRPALAEARQAR